MNSTHKWWAVHPKECGNIDREWKKAFHKKELCRGCGAASRTLFQSGLDIRLVYCPRTPAISGLGLDAGLIRTDFLEIFEPHFSREFRIGRAYDASGELIEGIVTYLTDHPVFLYGGPESTSRICQRCGRFVYDCLGKPYILGVSLDRRGPILGSMCGDLLLTEELASGIDRKKWKGIWVHEIPVLDEPRDGLKSIPENYFYRGDRP
jgi:hypothetical protein